MRSESTSALGHPRLTNPTFGWLADMRAGPENRTADYSRSAAGPLQPPAHETGRPALVAVATCPAGAAGVSSAHPSGAGHGRAHPDSDARHALHRRLAGTAVRHAAGRRGGDA